ncbi:MAG: electron transport complex subunit RsxB [Candidatus Thiothrix singaporensis]|uniref:Ion-translocating oxidoreductase complex subunit B n=1 Tax=Candidatus Thiothrix singaporensis TaxID=2799669 RepID=A0A7L6APG8_9GAMM|nr:MAG: electron transport complex subunit RsxB [Candidatus Thiothrix singaporensis]
MFAALLVLGGMAAAFGLLLGYAAIRFKVEGDPIADKVDALLPQTQCGQCGFPGCRPYAEAIAKGEAGVNRCPPGGEATIKALAELLGVEPQPLDTDEEHSNVPLLAVIDEQTCIGCTLCIQACPVDAIVGAAKRMHTVIEKECTGCKLCLPPCPVDCIRLIPVKVEPASWKWPYPVVEAAADPANDDDTLTKVNA